MANLIYWCLQKTPEPSTARACLSPAEINIYEGFRFEARQKSWLAGRFTAKHLVSQVYAGIPDGKYTPELRTSSQIEIRNNDLGAPSAYLNNQPLPGCLSISHSGDWAASAYAPSGSQIGIDLERITPRSDAFMQDYFTHNEVQKISAMKAEIGLAGEGLKNNQPAAELVTLIWSAKEAMLKALGIGLRIDTRQVEVRAIDGVDKTDPGNWNRLVLSSKHVSTPVVAYWQMFDRYLLTLVVLRNDGLKVPLIEVN